MHKQIPVAVLQAFDLRGQSYAPGQSVLIPTVDALILHRKKTVRITKRLEPAAPQPPQVLEDEQPKRKRTYKRRDMQAEETTSFDAEHDAKREEVNQPAVEPDPPSDE